MNTAAGERSWRRGGGCDIRVVENLLLLQISTSIVYDNKVSRKFFLNGFSGITALNFNNPVNTNTQKYKFVSNERILYLYAARINTRT